jgi:NAD(P)-dependent dehydrogenase (short-subunit alcohol dehydrogenase family)
MSITFQGPTALVTGPAGPRGIGRATALRLARSGADVACLDIARPYEDAPAHATATGDDLRDVVAEIEAMGRRAVAVRADVSNETEVEAAVEAAASALGTITMVANVAGDGFLERSLGGPERLARFLEREIPLRRLQSADEIAAVICWLLSEDAAA